MLFDALHAVPALRPSATGAPDYPGLTGHQIMEGGGPLPIFRGRIPRSSSGGGVEYVVSIFRLARLSAG